MSLRDRIIELRRIKASELTPNPANPRRHPEAQASALRGILDEIGFAGAELAYLDEGVLTLIDGHLRRDLAGDETIPVLVTDLTREEARKLLAVHDPIAAMATTDREAMAALLEGMDGREQVEAILAAADVPFAPFDLPEPPHIDLEPPSDPVTQPGDLWTLGNHRLICGDAREPETFERLLEGETIAVGFTSPPYADRRTYDETTAFRPVHPEAYVDWFAAVASNVAEHLAADGSWFVNIKEHCEDGQRVLYVKDLALAHVRQWGWRLVDELCWTRAGVPGGWPNRFKNGWEPVFHFSRQEGIKFRPAAVSTPTEHAFDSSPANGTSPSGSGLLGKEHGKRFREGMARPGNVLDIATGGGITSPDHPAAFPVGLPAFFALAYADAGDIICDPFAGSGSTILAAQQTGRIGRGIEISPAYCDVIARRYQQATGIIPERNGTPHTFEVTSALT